MWGRFRQVGYYLQPRLVPAELAWALGYLNEPQQALFKAMASVDRAHAVRVARRLEAQGAPAFVLEAALLHDCGKPKGYGLAGRVLGVLCSRWAKEVPQSPVLKGLERSLQIYRWHDQWGLEAAKAAGTSADALVLLQAYLAADGQTTEAPAWLEPLKRADDRG